MRVVAAIVTVLAAAAAPASGAPGDLDPSFGGGAGWVRTLEIRDATNNFLPRAAEDVVVQPDGKIVVTGKVIDGGSNRYFGALRYLPDGSLDESFGAGGLVALDLGAFEDARAVALQRDGKIVVAGETDSETARCFAAMRLNPDGSRDGTFGSGGVVTVPFYLRRWANDVAIDGHGRIVLAGVRLRGGDAQDSATVCVIRLLPDGRPDPGFSRDGVALVDHGYGNDSAEAVVLRGGKVIVAGDGREADGSRFGLARLRGDGRLDRSFGRRGHRLVSFGARRLATAYALTAAPGGRIVAVGGAVVEGRRPQFAIARLGRRGRLERRVRTGTGDDTAEAIALTPGHATIAGSIYSSHGLARYLTR